MGIKAEDIGHVALTFKELRGYDNGLAARWLDSEYGKGAGKEVDAYLKESSAAIPSWENKAALKRAFYIYLREMVKEDGDPRYISHMNNATTELAAALEERTVKMQASDGYKVNFGAGQG